MGLQGSTRPPHHHHMHHTLDAKAPTVSNETRGRTSGECGWAPRRAQVGARGRHTSFGRPCRGGGVHPKAPTWGTSLFPAKREVKREVLKVWLAWPGNQTSWKSLVRSLVQSAPSPGRPNGMLAAMLSCRHRCLRMNMAPHAMHLSCRHRCLFRNSGLQAPHPICDRTI